MLHELLCIKNGQANRQLGKCVIIPQKEMKHKRPTGMGEGVRYIEQSEA